MTSAGEDVEKLNPSQGDIATVQTVCLPLAVQRTEFPIESIAFPIWIHTPQNQSQVPQEHLYRNVHDSPPYTSLGEGNQPRYLSTDESINIMLYRYMKEYYSAIKQSTPTLHSSIWTDLEVI